MSPENRAALMVIVKEALANHPLQRVERVIYECHNGRLDGRIVTRNNLHLFRQYRNTVSGEPSVMTKEALEAV